MTRIALIACGKAKRDHPSPARDLYTGGLFTKARAYAEATSDTWFILSAKHGLVDPDMTLHPYDLTLNRLPKHARLAWAEFVTRQLNTVTQRGDTVTFLAGTRYRDDLAPRLVRRGVRVTTPLIGLSLGHQLRWLTVNTPDLAERGSPTEQRSQPPAEKAKTA